MASLLVNAKQHHTNFDDDRCPRCGLERATWRPSCGYSFERTLFCCMGCARQTGCTCVEVPENAKPKPGIHITHRSAFQERRKSGPPPEGQVERRSKYQNREN